jgi:hypothetical protein
MGFTNNDASVLWDGLGTVIADVAAIKRRIRLAQADPDTTDEQKAQLTTTLRHLDSVDHQLDAASVLIRDMPTS